MVLSSSPPKCPRRRSLFGAERLVLTCALLVIAAGGAGLADDVPNDAADAAPADEDDERVEEQRRTVAAMVWIVVGVAIVGVALLFCVLFWGAHTRRVVRSPLPGQTRDDPFWYLKKGKGGGRVSDEDDPSAPESEEADG